MSENRPLTGPMYHYTSISALVKIVTTQEIWASNAFYMNDASEIRHGIQVVQSRAAELYGSASCGDEAEVMRHLVGWVGNQGSQIFPFFVSCFSEKRDDLNQWRSYARGSRGVCIGFDSSVMHDCLREQNWDFMHVYYRNRDDLSAWSDAFVERARKALAVMEKEDENKEVSVALDDRDERYYGKAWDSVLDVLLVVASRIKNPNFSEELEWRLTSRLITEQRTKDIKYRVGSSMLIPYLPFKLVPGGASTMRLAEVIIPRTSGADLASRSLESFLRANGVEAPVFVSGVPFREL